MDTVPTKTPLRAVVQGLAAGVAGTALLTAYRQLTEPDEGSSGPPQSWSEAPEPAQVGQRVVEGVFQQEVPLERAPVVTQTVHWLYGTAWGAAYAILEESIRQPVVSGVALASSVVAADYTLLPAMNLYEPPWRYPRKVLARDFATHLVYGFGVAATYLALDRLGRRD